MSNPAAHIEFRCSGESEAREARLWEFLKVFTPKQLATIAWVEDHKGDLRIGMKRIDILSLSFLQKAKSQWSALGEVNVSIVHAHGLAGDIELAD